MTAHALDRPPVTAATIAVFLYADGARWCDVQSDDRLAARVMFVHSRWSLPLGPASNDWTRIRAVFRALLDAAATEDAKP